MTGIRHSSAPPEIAVPIRLGASAWQRLADHLLFPFNIWLSAQGSRRLGLTPIDHERIRAALPHCRGRLLDVACGDNMLVRTFGNGVGVDVHPYAGIDALCDSAVLPFRGGIFDTVALLASLNHITRRGETLRECRRVLRPDGVLLITMIHPWIGIVSHPIRRRHDPDQLERGIRHDEALGLTGAEIRRLLGESGFRLAARRRFMWALNALYIAIPADR